MRLFGKGQGEKEKGKKKQYQDNNKSALADEGVGIKRLIDSRNI